MSFQRDFEKTSALEDRDIPNIFISQQMLSGQDKEEEHVDDNVLFLQKRPLKKSTF